MKAGKQRLVAETMGREGKENLEKEELALIALRVKNRIPKQASFD